MDQDEPPTGWIASLRRLAETLLSTLHNRVELVSVELQEEKSRLLTTLIWAAAAIFFGLMAVILLVATIVYLVPDAARPWVLGGFTLLFVCLAISAFAGVKRELKDRRPPFADTLSELKKDVSWIRSKD